VTRHVIEWRDPPNGHEYRPSREEAEALVRERFNGRELELNDWGQFWDPARETVVAYIGARPSNSGATPTLPRVRFYVSSKAEVELLDRAAKAAGYSNRSECANAANAVLRRGRK